MTRRNAERIIGSEITQLDPTPDAKYRYSCGEAEAGSHKQSEALRLLVLRNYQRVSGLVLDKQKWLCARCGYGGNLSVHHKLFRSHGRRDTLDNLEALCLNCHGKAHGQK